MRLLRCLIEDGSRASRPRLQAVDAFIRASSMQPEKYGHGRDNDK